MIPTWLSDRESACQCRKCGFNPWAGNVPWRSKWQSTPVFLPGKSHGHRSLACCSPWGCKELDTSEQLNNKNMMKLITEEYRENQLYRNTVIKMLGNKFVV